jgi:integrase
MNGERLAELQKHNETRWGKEGVAIFDDTIVERTGKEIELASVFYDHTRGCFVRGHNIVTLHYADRKTSYPVDYRLYVPKGQASEFKTEIRLVTELVDDTLDMGLPAQTFVFDCWLRHFDVEIKRKLRIRNQDTTPTLDGERIPEADETAEIFNRADLRAGAIISLIAKAGLRPEVLGMHDASDGLKIKDLPDLTIIQGLATFTRTPARIMVRKSLSKAGHEYMTFLTTEGCKKLLAYLNDRIINGESVGPEDAVIAPLKKHTKYRGNNEGKKHLSTPLIERAVRKILRPRFDWRPYVFHRFFDTRLLIAESRGKVAHDFRVFWMGHKGSIEAVYTTNKGILPQSLLEEMREAFRRSEELLDIEKTEEDSLENQKRALQEKVAQMTPEEVQELLRLLGSCESSGSSHQMKQSDSYQKVGNLQELYPTARSSSKNKIWTSRVSGPGGIWTHDLLVSPFISLPVLKSQPL